MIIDAPWLEARGTQFILKLLESDGYQALAVGGCVRNHLLHMPVADVDIATDAHPDQVVRLATEAGIKSVPTGIEHGTVTLVSDGTGFEVTTFRRDVATDGRRATVSYSQTIEEDAKRRDFTMNALYVYADGRLVDPLDGMSDILARRLRFIGDPDQRIREDYLRILRFFRFHSWYADTANGFDPDALNACKNGRRGLELLSDERIGGELRKLLSAPDPVPAIITMADIGVLDMALPGASAGCLSEVIALEISENITPSWERRLVALGGDETGRRMRFSKAEARHLRAIDNAVNSGVSAAESAFRFGAAATLDTQIVKAAREGRTALAVGVQSDITLGSSAEFPVSASDLLPKIPQGPALGAKLQELREQWIASGFTLKKEQLLRQ